MKAKNNYNDVTVNRLFNALLGLWNKPRNAKARAYAEVVLHDVFEMMEDKRIKENMKKAKSITTSVF
jgi:hypothetical protein